MNTKTGRKIPAPRFLHQDSCTKIPAPTFSHRAKTGELTHSSIVQARQNVLSIAAVLAAALLFGTTGTAQELGPAGSTPLGVGAMRLVVGAITLWCLVGRLPEMTLLRRQPRLLILGGICVAIYQPGFFLGTERSGVALGTIVALGSGPVFAGLLELFWLHRRPTNRWVVATSVMLVGGVLLVVGGGGDASFSVIGTLGSLSSGFGYGLFAIVNKRLIERGVHSTTSMAWEFTIGSPLLALLMIGQPTAWLATASGIAISLYLGVLVTGFAYLLYGWGLRSISTSTAVTLTLAEPLTAAVLAVVVLDERLRWFGWLGAGVVIVGLAVAARSAIGSDGDSSRLESELRIS